jgi:hypothetical protein
MHKTDRHHLLEFAAAGATENPAAKSRFEHMKFGFTHGSFRDGDILPRNICLMF